MKLNVREAEELIRKIWSDGVNDFEEIDRNWDPSDREEAMNETFKGYWENNGKELQQALENLMYNYI